MTSSNFGSGIIPKKEPWFADAIWRSCRWPDRQCPSAHEPPRPSTATWGESAPRSRPLFSSSFAIHNLANPASWAAVDDARPDAINGGAHVRPTSQTRIASHTAAREHMTDLAGNLIRTPRRIHARPFPLHTGEIGADHLRIEHVRKHADHIGDDQSPQPMKDSAMRGRAGLPAATSASASLDAAASIWRNTSTSSVRRNWSRDSCHGNRQSRAAPRAQG